MFHFDNAYKVYATGTQPYLPAVAVGIRNVAAAIDGRLANAYEFLINHPLREYERVYAGDVREHDNGLEIDDLARPGTTWHLVLLTIEEFDAMRDYVMGFDTLRAQLHDTADVQNYYVSELLLPWWEEKKDRNIEEALEGKLDGDIATADLDEAAPVGTVHSRKDGYDWQKMPNKTWVRIGRTYGRGAEHDEPPEEEEESDLGKWPEIEVPAGGTWKDRAEGFEHLSADQYGQPSTMHTYYDQDDVTNDETITPKAEHEERYEQLWDEINRRSGFTSRRTTPKEGRRPVAVLTMGVPASGKTEAIKNVVADKEGFVHIDPDSIKSVIPEFREAVGQRARNAASMVHWESAMLAERLRNHARDNGKNFIFEGVGRDPVYYGAMIDDLKQHGYEVQIVMTHVEDEEKAVERSNVRGERSGRWVHEPSIRRAVPAVPKSFAQLHSKVDAFSVFDTEEFPPKLAWARRGTEEVVPDPELKDRLTRGVLRREEPVRERPREEAKKLPPTAPPDISHQAIIKAFQRAFEVDHAQMELTPRRFRKDQGIVYPEPKR